MVRVSHQPVGRAFNTDAYHAGSGVLPRLLRSSPMIHGTAPEVSRSWPRSGSIISSLWRSNDQYSSTSHSPATNGRTAVRLPPPPPPKHRPFHRSFPTRTKSSLPRANRGAAGRATVKDARLARSDVACAPQAVFQTAAAGLPIAEDCGPSIPWRAAGVGVPIHQRVGCTTLAIRSALLPTYMSTKKPANSSSYAARVPASYCAGLLQLLAA